MVSVECHFVSHSRRLVMLRDWMTTRRIAMEAWAISIAERSEGKKNVEMKKNTLWRLPSPKAKETEKKQGLKKSLVQRLEFYILMVYQTIHLAKARFRRWERPKGYTVCTFLGRGLATGNLLPNAKDKSYINEMPPSKMYKTIGSKQCDEDGLCVNSSRSGAGTTLNMIQSVTNSNCLAHF